MANRDDVELIERYLAVLGDEISNVEAARRTGISEARVRAWRDGDRRPLRPTTRAKLRRYIERAAAGRTDMPPELSEGLRSLLFDRQSLYQALSNYGAPGESVHDKEALIELLYKVAARLRREGRQIPLDLVNEAHADLLNGEV